MVQTTGLQNHQMGVFLVGYKFKQFEVLKVVLLKIQLFGMLNHCSATSCDDLNIYGASIFKVKQSIKSTTHSSWTI